MLKQNLRKIKMSTAAILFAVFAISGTVHAQDNYNIIYYIDNFGRVQAAYIGDYNHNIEYYTPQYNQQAHTQALPNNNTNTASSKTNGSNVYGGYTDTYENGDSFTYSEAAGGSIGKIGDCYYTSFGYSNC